MGNIFGAADLIRDLYGVSTTPRINPLISSVGTTPLKACSDNPKRVSLLILNMSSNVVYVGTGTDVSSSKGILLSPNGGSLMFNFKDDMQLVNQEFWVVASAAASSIYVLENTIYKGH